MDDKFRNHRLLRLLMQLLQLFKLSMLLQKIFSYIQH